MRRPILLLLVLVPLSTSAEATLIDLGNGTIYDTIQDLTWLQDLTYARTSGYDSDGRMTAEEAHAWADGLVFGGYSDWRLPRMRTVALENGSDTEVNDVMAQLGGYWRDQHHYEAPVDYGPFINPFVGYWLEPPPGVFMGYAWLVFREVDWAAFHWDYDVPGPGAWAVRDGGNPMARVPEPSALSLLTIGVVGAWRALRPRRVIS